MMRVIPFSMPGRLRLEYGAFQVLLKNTYKGYNKNLIIWNQRLLRGYTKSLSFLGQIAFGDCAGFTQTGWNRKEAVYILPRSQRWLELQPHYFIERWEKYFLIT